MYKKVAANGNTDFVATFHNLVGQGGFAAQT